VALGASLNPPRAFAARLSADTKAIVPCLIYQTSGPFPAVKILIYSSRKCNFIVLTNFLKSSMIGFRIALRVYFLICLCEKAATS